MAAENDDVNSIWNWEQLPICARSCKILEISALNCVPPAAPAVDTSIYRDCVCQSDFLWELHINGEICHSDCPHEDDIIISRYYNHICGWPQGSGILPGSATSPAKTTAITTSSSTAAVADTPASSFPAATEPHQEAAKDEEPWLHKNGKYFGIAGGSIIVIVLIILLSIMLLRRRNKAQRKLARARSNRSIPLQPLRPSTPPSRPSNDYWPPPSTPYTTSPPISPVTGRPFGETLRMYASDREDVQSDSAPAVNSPSQMEAIINDRIRRTGQPGIPMRDTPRIVR